MSFNRKNGHWLLIVFLLTLHAYMGEQQAITSCPAGQFLARDINPTTANSAGSEKPGCLDLKYFVFDAKFYDSAASNEGKCDTAIDLKLDLYGQIYKGCVSKSQLTYLCLGYSRTENGTNHGIYACIGCPTQFKYIVTRTAGPFAPATGVSSGNPLGLTFAKFCTIQLIPNCNVYQITTYGATAGTNPASIYAAYTYAWCNGCNAGITKPGVSTDFFYYNPTIKGWEEGVGVGGTIGFPCIPPGVLTNLACTTYKLSPSRQYVCNTCAGGAILYYQSGTYSQKCVLVANLPKYFDPNCILYDSFDASSSAGKCVKCANGHQLITVFDNAAAVVQSRLACIPVGTRIALQPCPDIYISRVPANQFNCRGCSNGFTLVVSTTLDTSVPVGKCVANDRYLPIDKCITITPKVIGDIDNDASNKCTTCVNGVGSPYCTNYTQTIVADNSKQQFGTRCTNGNTGFKQITSSFVRKDTGQYATVFGCVNTGIIDNCLDYVSTIVYTGNPPVLNPAAGSTKIPSTLNCQVCFSGYTLVTTAPNTFSICIKNSQVVQSCLTYNMATLRCSTCNAGTTLDSVSNTCKVSDTQNCALSTLDTTIGKRRCISCLPNFTLIRYDDGYSCVSSVLGCSNLTNSGICLGCASSSQQLVAGRLCVTLPLNCKNVGSDGNCTDCNAGFIFNPTTLNCDQIANFGTPVTCPDGQYFDSNGVCVVGSIGNCSKYNVSGVNIRCSKCKDGYHSSRFGNQCDPDEPQLAGVKCQDRPAGNSYVWVRSTWSGECLKKDKNCGDQSHEVIENHMIYCGTCLNGFMPDNGLCYDYTRGNNTSTNNPN